MQNFHKLPVKEIIRETRDAVTILFYIPENLKNEFRFIPGQYITIQKIVNGELLRRAYSISSSPKSKEIRVTVKAIKDGKFSVFANTRLKEGDIIDVSIPEGKFILNTDSKHRKNYLGFAAGSGITPVLSMIKSVLETEKDSKFILVYGSKSDDQTIFKAKLDELSKSFPNNFEVNYVFSQKLSDYALSGRINKKIVSEITQKRYKELTFDEVFICGPEQMIDTVKGSLIDQNITSKNIHFELFSSSPSKENIINPTGTTQITFILDEEEKTLEMKKEEVILNIALKNNLDAPYSCQGGICSSCLAKIVEGNAVMEKNKILDKKEIAEGLILTCQAHPTTSKIVIDFDNV